MTSVTLRTLVREPRRIKRITRAGKSVQVTDKGKPLWILRPANGSDVDEAERRHAIDEILDEVLREKPSKISLSKFLSNLADESLRRHQFSGEAAYTRTRDCESNKLSTVVSGTAGRFALSAALQSNAGANIA
jgi:hypothetical protein